MRTKGISKEDIAKYKALQSAHRFAIGLDEKLDIIFSKLFENTDLIDEEELA